MFKRYLITMLVLSAGLSISCNYQIKQVKACGHDLVGLAVEQLGEDKKLNIYAIAAGHDEIQNNTSESARLLYRLRAAAANNTNNELDKIFNSCMAELNEPDKAVRSGEYKKCLKEVLALVSCDNSKVVFHERTGYKGVIRGISIYERRLLYNFLSAKTSN